MTVCVINKYLQTHCPSAMVNPSLQMHLYVPFKFSHSELIGQIAFVVSLHSSISSVQFTPVHPFVQLHLPVTLSHDSVFPG